MSHVVHDNVVRRTVSTRYNATKKKERMYRRIYIYKYTLTDMVKKKKKSRYV